MLNLKHYWGSAGEGGRPCVESPNFRRVRFPVAMSFDTVTTTLTQNGNVRENGFVQRLWEPVWAQLQGSESRDGAVEPSPRTYGGEKGTPLSRAEEPIPHIAHRPTPTQTPLPVPNP